MASSKTEKSGMRETGGKNWRREKETIETAKLQHNFQVNTVWNFTRDAK